MVAAGFADLSVGTNTGASTDPFLLSPDKEVTSILSRKATSSSHIEADPSADPTMAFYMDTTSCEYFFVFFSAARLICHSCSNVTANPISAVR